MNRHQPGHLQRTPRKGRRAKSYHEHSFRSMCLPASTEYQRVQPITQPKPEKLLWNMEDGSTIADTLPLHWISGDKVNSMPCLMSVKAFETAGNARMRLRDEEAFQGHTHVDVDSVRSLRTISRVIQPA